MPQTQHKKNVVISSTLLLTNPNDRELAAMMVRKIKSLTNCAPRTGMDSVLSVLVMMPVVEIEPCIMGSSGQM